MNKKEISEIKKQFTPANCAITRIRGCYVDGEKNRVAEFANTFLSLPEEEMYKYFEIFRKALSGTLGKNLLNMEFPLDSEMEGGTQHFLLQLRDSRLEDDELMDQYYTKVIESLAYGENYLILTIHAAYDIPGKASDNLDMFDSSDEVFNFIISCICPVSLSKPALSYDAQEGCFHNRIRDWVVDLPMIAFLFPVFEDRSTDIHKLLYYTKNAEEPYESFYDSLIGCALPPSAESQRETFTDLIQEALGDACDYETVRGLHEQLHELKEQQKDSPDPVILHQSEVRNLLELAGASQEQMSAFDETYEKTAGPDAAFMADNIMNTKKYEVKTPDVTVQVSPDRADLVETKIIDGRPCLIIPITDEILVNGISIKQSTIKGSLEADSV